MNLSANGFYFNVMMSPNTLIFFAETWELLLWRHEIYDVLLRDGLFFNNLLVLTLFNIYIIEITTDCLPIKQRRCANLG